MSLCPRCGKPVFFAERRTSLGQDWHRECLVCVACLRVLTPGSHVEHQGQPYCEVPCYRALFGPALVGHGADVSLYQYNISSQRGVQKSADRRSPSEDHSSQRMPVHGTYTRASQKELEDLIGAYSKTCPEDCLTLKQTESGELCVEGYLRVHWGVTVPIHFKKDDGVLPTGTRALRFQPATRLSYAVAMKNSLFEDSDPEGDSNGDADNGNLQPVEKTFGIADTSFRSRSLNRVWTYNGHEKGQSSADQPAAVTVKMRKPPRHAKAGVVKQARANRRFSINGHFYRPETAAGFVPTFGMPTRVRASSRASSLDVVAMLLGKFKIETPTSNFGLYIVKDNGDIRALQHDEPPLLLGTMLRESPDVKIFLMDVSAATSASQLACSPVASASSELVADRQEQQATAEAAGNASAVATDVAYHGHKWQATSDFESLPEPMLQAFIAKFTKDENEDILRVRNRYGYLRKQLEVLLQQAAMRSDSGLVETYL